MSHSFPSALVTGVSLSLALLGAPLAAQQSALQEAWTGAVLDGGAGASVALLGDLDGDGVDDLAWGEPRYTEDHVSSGRVIVRSGADGSTLVALLGAAGGDLFGAALAGGGDFDGDGTPDILVGSPGHDDVFSDGGLATVYSGATLLPLMSFEPGGATEALGAAVDFVGDLDGDGDDEVLVGAPTSTSSGVGYARLYAGGTGAVLATFTSGMGGGDQMGRAVADVGDINGDDFADIGVGAPALPLHQGFVQVYSGRAIFQGLGPVLLRQLAGPNTFYDAFGTSVDGVGDVNGDGRADFAVGNPLVTGQGGMVSVYSGLNGAELLRFDGVAGSRLGAAVAGLGDIDGDGVPDLGAVGRGKPQNHQAGLARAWSGATGALLIDVPVDTSGVASFAAVAPGGDRDGDGRAEVLFGVSDTVVLYEQEFTGRGKLLRVEPEELLVMRGRSLRGEHGVPWLAATGDLTPNSPIEFRVVGGLPSAPLFFVVGLSEVFVPLEGGVLVPAPDIILGLGLDAAGGITLGGSWPAGVPAGLTVSFQGWIVDAGGPFGFAATHGTSATTP